MKLTPNQKQILTAMKQGQALILHRSHPTFWTIGNRVVTRRTITCLRKLGAIQCVDRAQELWGITEEARAALAKAGVTE